MPPNADNVDLNNVLLEVLNSESSFGEEMRQKISSSMDIATKNMEKKISSMKVSNEPTTMMTILGVDKSEQEKIASQIQIQQKKILTWIKEISMASNWKQLRSGITINDIFVSDKMQNKRFEEQYRTLQTKILNAMKSNIPTKMDVIPKIATSKAVKQPTPEIPKEVKNKKAPLLGVPGLEEKESILTPPVRNKFSQIEDSKKEVFETKDSKKEEITLLSAILKKLDELVNTTNGSVQSEKKTTEIAGRETFVEKTPETIVSEFDDKALDQLTKAMSGIKKEKEVKEMKPEKEGFLKRVLEFAGLSALLGLITYLVKNPEVWDNAKKFFKEKFIPWLKELPETLAGVGTFIVDFSSKIKNAFVKAQDWMEKTFWPAMFASWDWIKNKFNYAQDWMEKTFWPAIFAAWDWIGKKFDEVSIWINEKVIDPIKGFATKAWKGIKEASAWFNKKVIDPIKDFATNVWKGIKSAGSTIKKTILAIPDFLKDKFAEIRTSFIETLKKIPWVGKLIEKAEETQQIERGREIAKQKISTTKQALGRRLTPQEQGAISAMVKRQTTSEQSVILGSLGNEKASIKEANSTPNVTDFIYRPGQPIQSFSNEDVVIGAKEKLVIENKNLDKQMHDLTSVMEHIQDKFDDLLMLNAKLVERSTVGKSRVEPLPEISSNIDTYRGISYDDAYNHKMKVWELLHGV